MATGCVGAVAVGAAIRRCLWEVPPAEVTLVLGSAILSRGFWTDPTETSALDAEVASVTGPQGSDRKPWIRFAGLGIELASITLGLAGIGYVIDSRRGHTTPYVTAAGALVGFSYGMFRFIQKATSVR